MAGQYEEVINAVLRGHTVRLEPDVASAATLRTVIWRELQILKRQERNMGILDGMGSRSISIIPQKDGALVVKLVFNRGTLQGKGIDFVILDDDLGDKV